jgi:hypothetical protein
MFLQIALNILTSALESIVQKRQEKGKSNKLLQKAFSEETQMKVAKAYESYMMLAIELQEELEDEG